MAKGPRLPTLEERWAQDDAIAPFGMSPITGEMSIEDDSDENKKIDLDEIEAELDGDGDENEEAAEG